MTSTLSSKFHRPISAQLFGVSLPSPYPIPSPFPSPLSQPHRQAEQTNGQPVEGMTKEQAESMVGGMRTMPGVTSGVQPNKEMRVVNKQARAEPVNLDGG